MAAGDPKLDVPLRFTRSAVVDKDWSRASALWQLDFVCGLLGLPDLASTSVLDMGCGIKMSETILNEGIAIKRYVGVDVFEEMITYLLANVDDPRFEYHHVSLYNELYNPTGPRLADTTALPVHETFDLIWLFSVFTHLPPDDFRAMLQLLRPYVRDAGRLFFTLYINEETEGGHGFVDSLAKRLQANPELLERRRRPIDEAVPPYHDVSPDHPLRTALYSREHAMELIDGTGWRPLLVLDPGPYIQHSILCEPC